MRLKTILSAVVLVLIGLVVVAYAVAKSIDFNAYKDLVTQQVKVALGRDLVIAGDVSVEIGLVPHLTAKQITLQNADWSDQRQMVSIDQLDAEIELLPLLFEQIRIRQITLKGGTLILERNEKGIGNWTFNGASSSGGSSAPLPDVGRVKLSGVTLRYRDPVHGLDKTLQVDQFTAEAAASGGAIAWSLTGATSKNQIDLKGNLGAISQMTTGPYPIDLNGRIGDVSLQGRATIASLSTLHGLDVDAQLSGSDAAKLNSLFDGSLPQTAPFKIATHLADQDKGYHFDHITVSFGKSSFNGDMSIFVDRDQPLIKAQLTSDRIDLADFGLAAPSNKAEVKPTSDRLFSSDPWRFDALQRVDADLLVSVGELLRGQSILKDGKVSLKLERGVLTLRSLTAAIDQGRLDATGSLQAATDKPAMELQVKGANMASAPLLNVAGLSDVLSAGAVNLDLAVKGPVTSEHDLMAGLAGNMQFNTGAGSLRNSFARFLLADLTKLVSFGGSADAATINCLAGHFDIDKGIARTNSLVMDTPGAALLGSGSINFGAETLNMRVDSKSKQVSLAVLAVPIVISGSLQHPSVAPDAMGALANTGDFVAGAANTVSFGTLNSLTGLGGGSGGSNACATVADNSAKASSAGSKIKQGATAVGNGTKQVIEGVGQGAGNVAKDVGNSVNSGLKSIFGN